VGDNEKYQGEVSWFEMLKATISICTVTSVGLVRDGEIGHTGSFAVSSGHFFHSNLIIAWTALPNCLLSAAC